MLVLSFAPKFIFTKQYLDRTATYLKAQQNTFELIKNNTLENDVIILDPNNILNRYIPFYSARYVFSGGETISKDQQWNLLSFCSGSPYIKDCTNRNKLASNFFNYPSQDTLSKIRSEYRINYLLVSKTKQIEYNKFLDSDLNLSELVTENASYSLYKIQP